eukprot:SAG31_NODE_7405_length_1697_cov_1.684606_2_plen_57_part_01
MAHGRAAEVWCLCIPALKVALLESMTGVATEENIAAAPVPADAIPPITSCINVFDFE